IVMIGAERWKHRPHDDRDEGADDKPGGEFGEAGEPTAEAQHERDEQDLRDRGLVEHAGREGEPWMRREETLVGRPIKPKGAVPEAQAVVDERTPAADGEVA